LEVAVVGLVNPPLLCNLFFDGVMVPWADCFRQPNDPEELSRGLTTLLALERMFFMDLMLTF
jgi:hypothetical protein